MKYQSYSAVMARKNDIIQKAMGIDYERFVKSSIAFDYDMMMAQAGYSLEKITSIQTEAGVGRTPLIELKNLTNLNRKISTAGKGARIFIKDEAANPSGSFKDRRASLSVFHAKQNGFPGVAAATSGNYGAAVASQAAQSNLPCIIVQEVFDSQGKGQPEIIEKTRKCEAYGAEVLQLSVGPELFYVLLRILEETGYFNASLYTPLSIAGIETLGAEIAHQSMAATGRHPDMVVCTHAGGGNLTGTARGLIKAGADNTTIVGASVDLSGLHMASDRDFNRKSFTTGHTGFGVPFLSQPDRVDVPRNAARALRYMDLYVLVSQGEVFYVTQALAQLEGLERGPAGNTSLAAGFALARELDRDSVLVVQETEYTGAGKHPTAQLTFAKEMSIQVFRGNPADEIPGQNIIIPEFPEQIKIREYDLQRIRRSLIINTVNTAGADSIHTSDIEFLAAETKSDSDFVRGVLEEMGVSVPLKPEG